MQTSLDSPGSYLTPSLEHARVRDAMRPRLLTVEPGATLRSVAGLMAREHVHAVVVLRDRAGPAGRAGGIVHRALDVVSDLDLVGASSSIDELTAGDAARAALTIPADRPLAEAARLMTEHSDAHLIVVDPASGRPVGMLSTLDLAAILAWGQA